MMIGMEIKWKELIQRIMTSKMAITNNNPKPKQVNLCAFMLENSNNLCSMFEITP